MKYKNIIWDFDGTLFDTYGEIAKVIEEVLHKKGLTEDYQALSNNLHISLTQTLKWVAKNHCLVYDQLLLDFMKAEEQMNVHKALPFDGVESIINAVKGYNFIVTNRGASIFRFLEAKDFTRYFEKILYRDSGFKLKPSSATVDHLIENYNLKREETLFIGDRDMDLECAISAGIDSCYFDSHNIPNTIPCTYYVKTFKELSDILDIS